MRKKLLCTILSLLMVVSTALPLWISAAEDPVINVPDPVLKKYLNDYISNETVRESILESFEEIFGEYESEKWAEYSEEHPDEDYWEVREKYYEENKRDPDHDITKSEMESLTYLYIWGMDNICKSLEGLQYAVNLEWIYLEGNEVTQLNENIFTGMTNLNRLVFYSTKTEFTNKHPAFQNLEKVNKDVEIVLSEAFLFNAFGLPETGVNGRGDPYPPEKYRLWDVDALCIDNSSSYLDKYVEKNGKYADFRNFDYSQAVFCDIVGGSFDKATGKYTSEQVEKLIVEPNIFEPQDYTNGPLNVKMSLKSNPDIYYTFTIGFTKYPRVTKVSDNGTKISVFGGNLPDNCTVDVTVDNEGSVQKAKAALQKIDIGKFFVYDINLLDENGATIQPKGKVTVSVPIPDFEQYIKDPTAWYWPPSIYYIDSNGVSKNMNGKLSADGKHIEFETDHFSTYALTFTEKAKNVKTSDHFDLLSIIIILASGAAITLLSKKRKIPTIK